jgi:hypothetical protein
MKKILLVAIVAIALIALMCGTAFAEGKGTGSYTNTAISTGLTWSNNVGSAGDGFYMDATGNPHGGFSDTSHNCQVCHSVHAADSAGEALLMDTVANACIYCHINPGTAGYIAIYDGNADNYTGVNTAGLDFGHQSLGGAECGSCHQVHAASSLMVSAANGYGADMPYLVTKLLKVDGTGTDLKDSAASTLQFTGSESNEVAVSMWCTECHGGAQTGYGYFNAGYNGRSHVMGDATTNYTSPVSGVIGQIAESGSNACSSCHNRGEINVTPALPGAAVTSQYNFPHWSDGVRFLTTLSGGSAAPATDAHADGVCLNCHTGVDTAGGGVGIGY